MKKGLHKLLFILSSTFALTFLFLTLALPEQITLTTYYPAPYGVYKELQAERMAIGENYYDSSQHCWPDGSCASPDIDADADLIVEGNVGIGTAQPDEILDVSSTTSGFLPPRMSNANLLAIENSVTEGSVAYDSTNHKLVFHNGTEWVSAFSKTVMQTGNYVGNGNPDRKIPVNFKPKFVMVAIENNIWIPFFKTDTFTLPGSRSFYTNFNSVNTIIHLLNDGFTVGNSFHVNGPGNTYQWVAIGEE